MCYCRMGLGPPVFLEIMAVAADIGPKYATEYHLKVINHGDPPIFWPYMAAAQPNNPLQPELPMGLESGEGPW